MKYFIYDKKDSTVACLCIVEKNDEIKSTKIIKHKFDLLTKKNVEKEWPWINSEGEHIYLYKGDEMPEKFPFKYLLDEALAIEVPKLITMSREEILKTPAHMIDFVISNILLYAYLFFIENPESICEFDALDLYKERNELNEYLIEDLMVDIEEILLNKLQ